MTGIPRDRALDSSLALLSEGYAFIGNRCRRFRSDVFQTRLLGRRAFCVQGEDAARMFYEPGRFTRRGALPAPTLRLLQDQGSVATLDGEAHRRRKALFLSLVTPENVARLGERFEAEWLVRLTRWERSGSLVLFPGAEAVLCRAVCAWAGLPLSDPEARLRTAEFSAMIDGAGAFGPRNWRGQMRRARTERWARRAVSAIRGGRPEPAEDRAAYVIAWWRDERGELLEPSVAAVELLNVLRPTVAVARFIVFAALALEQHPESRAALQRGEDGYARLFAEEVRRYFPFVPAMAGRALVPFEWRGRRFEPGAWFVLDLYGGNHDPRAWRDAEAFDPRRFTRGEGGPFTFVPQGGGRYEDGHRCPGEAVTVDLIARAARLLARGMDYTVPPQDLSVDLSRMPAIPRSRFVIADVRVTL